MSKLTNITLHGVLGEEVGRNWKLAVTSVGEAVRGIQTNSKKLYKALAQNDKKNIKYRVLINKKDFFMEEGKDPNTREGLMSSELVMNFKKLDSIDIVPVIEGAGDSKGVLTIVIGIMLIAVGIYLPGPVMMGQMSGALVMGGIGLVAAGISALLTPKPEFGDFREVEGSGARASYMFGGPQNTVKEGGPVFVGYGRLLVGSHVVQTSVDTFDTSAEIDFNETWGQDKYGLRYVVQHPSTAATLLPKRVREWTSTPSE